ncbi:MAG: type II toxin-antitoxin system VapC family toxin [Symploca sp. SIO1B1]|nr:type II toxin-antitoxin system VapC family toxin [Symploca sp. SIO1B1]
MTQYLLDTNIILRASDQTSANYSLVVEAVFNLLNRGDQCFLTPQVLTEFWVVATRPLEANGLGWTPEKTQGEIEQLLSQFTLLPESGDIFTYWLQLVTTYKIKGKRTHDIRILAVMKANNLKYLLTLNPGDFLNIPGFNIVHPSEIVTP